MFSNQNTVQPLWNNGPAPGQVYNFCGQPMGMMPAELVTMNPPGGVKRIATPVTTGSSVVGIRFEDGVIMAADTLISYGSLARYQKTNRIFKLNDRMLLGGGGDFADVQFIKRTIDQKIIEDQCCDDQIDMKPKALTTWLMRTLYSRRSRMNPLQIDVLVGGIDENDRPYLSNTDLRGRMFDDYVATTGFARHLVVPLVREQKEEGKELTFEVAADLIRKSMEVLYYRDTRNISHYTVGICRVGGECTVEGPFEVNQKWNFAEGIVGY